MLILYAILGFVVAKYTLPFGASRVIEPQVASESLKASVRQLGDYAPLEEYTPDVLAEGHSTELVLERSFSTS